MAPVPITESLIPLAPSLKLKPPRSPRACAPTPPASSTSHEAEAGEDDDFASSLACPKLPFTQQLLPSPPPSPFRNAHSNESASVAAPEFPPLVGGARVSVARLSSFTAPPLIALPPAPTLPHSPPHSPPIRTSSRRVSRDTPGEEAELSHPEEEDEFEAELESELALLFPLPPTHGSSTPPRTTSSLPKTSKSSHRLSSSSNYSLASPTSARFHLPLLAPGGASPRLGADPSFGRPMSVDFTTFAVKDEGGEGKRDVPRFRDRRQADMDESRAQVRLSALVSELGV